MSAPMRRNGSVEGQVGYRFADRAARLKDSAIREMLKLIDRPGMISFAGGWPDPRTFPAERIREACNTVLREDADAALQYSPSEGFMPLREWIANDLSSAGARIEPERVLITSGSQQAIDLLGKVLVQESQTVLLETPAYIGALQSLSLFGPEFVAVESDEDGPLPSELIAHGSSHPIFLSLVPNYQNPTGRRISASRRTALVDAAKKQDVLFVEDDPYRELGFEDDKLPTLLSLNPDGVVYLGSFSKLLAPGLRVGYAVAPIELHRKLVQAKQAADLHTSSLTQRVVFDVIRDGSLPALARKIAALYAERCGVMLEALEQHLPAEAVWHAPAGGMFVWVELPAKLDSTDLLQRAIDANVAFLPGRAFYADNPAANTIRLSFVSAEPDEIREGIGRLGKLIERCLRDE